MHGHGLFKISRLPLTNLFSEKFPTKN